MNDSLFGPIVLSSGIGWNPTVTEADDEYTRVQQGTLDLIVSIRGQTPNSNLGQTDKYIWVGEFELALQSIQVAILEHPALRNELVDILLNRLIAYMSAE